MFCSDMNKQGHKSTLVLGNGFDLDLGMKTTWANFKESVYWSNLVETIPSPLILFLNNNCSARWGNVEDALQEYATSGSHSTYDEDKKSFVALCNSFADFLRVEVWKLSNDNIGEDNMSVAQYFINHCIYRFDKVYSFNYTPLPTILNRVFEINAPGFHCEHVHGNIGFSEHSIILGIENEVDPTEDYSFLFKSYNPFYKHTELESDLLNSDEIVFFGLSFSNSDFHYFDLLFNEIINKNKRNLSLIIFDYSNDSEQRLLNQIRSHGYNIDNLKQRCNYLFIPTEGGINSANNEALFAFKATFYERHPGLSL